MRRASKKLKRFEQFQPEESIVEIDAKRLKDLIRMSIPLLDEITKIIEQDEDRTISIEMYNKINSSIQALEELKIMY